MPLANLDRRCFLGAAALAPLTAPFPDSAAQGELEKHNEEIVNRFCADWSKRDAGALTGYFTDDIVYQITVGMPLVEGKAQFVAQLDPFMKRFAKIDWQTLRSQAMGDLVLNERIDYFIAEESGKSVTYHVCGVFVLKDGLIRDWRDYPFPKEA